MAAAAGGLDAQSLARAQRAQRLGTDVGAVDRVAPHRPRAAPVGARRSMPAALADQRVGHVLERLDLPDHAVAAAVGAVAARAAADRVLRDPQRERALERLD